MSEIATLVDEILTLLERSDQPELLLACRHAVDDLEDSPPRIHPGIGNREVEEQATDSDRLAVVLRTIRTHVTIPLECWRVGCESIVKACGATVGVVGGVLDKEDIGRELDEMSAGATDLDVVLRQLWEYAMVAEKGSHLGVSEDPFSVEVV